MPVKEGHCVEGLQNNTISTKYSLPTQLVEQKQLTQSLASFTVDAIHIVLIPKFLSSSHGAEFWQKTENHGDHRKLKWPNFFSKVLGLSSTVT